jgi:agmatine deiminase
MNNNTSTPSQLGYRMPAEWQPHAGTWLSWPRRAGFSFRPRYDEVVPTFGALVRALTPHETVNICVGEAALEAEARGVIGNCTNVQFYRVPTNEPWCRDHGPTFVSRDGEIAIVDWDYNAYGGKYPRYDNDCAVPERVAGVLKLPLFKPGIILEGGSFDVNGAGKVLTTEACLLHPNRNPHLSKTQIEEFLRNFLGATEIIWLGMGLIGDDTDGHVDDITRFVSPDTVVTVVENDPLDENYAVLQDNLARLRQTSLNVVELPMPAPVVYKEHRLPASYANFYIANGVVIVPVFGDANDDRACAILQSVFPDRQVVPLDSSTLIWGRGSFHCVTQQQPAIVRARS